MNRRDFVKAGLSVASVSAWPGRDTAAAQAVTHSASEDWIPLFNGHDLSGWYSYLNKSGRGAAERLGLIAVEEGMLHVMANVDDGEQPEIGYLSTSAELENVHLRLEYKWGVKRFNPRRFAKRDNGVLYGLVGEDMVWPACVEFQIEEGDVGDCFMVGGFRGIQDSHSAGFIGTGLSEDGWPNSAAMARPSLHGIPPGTGAPDPVRIASERTTVRKVKEGNFENLNDWNTVELIWKGDRAAHIVNGTCVNVISGIERPDPQKTGSFLPLAGGRVAIEIEYAEIWIRRVEMRRLTA